VAYRSNPVEDVQILPYRSAGHGPKSGDAGDDSTLLIDATLKHAMPPLALPAQPFMQRARQIWEELGLPRLTPQPPWHGYDLGDWNAGWQEFADNAVKGEWAKNGENTFARRRGGLTPETPVRNVENKKPWTHLEE
jgi:hypothetical protein